MRHKRWKTVECGGLISSCCCNPHGKTGIEEKRQFISQYTKVTFFGNVGHLHALFIGHKPQSRKDGKSSQDACPAIHYCDDNSVSAKKVRKLLSILHLFLVSLFHSTESAGNLQGVPKWLTHSKYPYLGNYFMDRNEA